MITEVDRKREELDALNAAIDAVDDDWCSETSPTRRTILSARLSALQRLKVRIEKDLAYAEPWTIADAIRREG